MSHTNANDDFDVEIGSVLVAVVDKVSSRVSTGDMLLTLAVPLEKAAILAPFLSKIGKHVGVAFADLDSAPTRHHAQPVSHPFGSPARQLFASGFFRSQALLECLGLTPPQSQEAVAKHLAGELGFDSIGDVPPTALSSFLREKDLEWLVPSSYKK